MVSTYNEPLITAEWGVAIFKEAREQGLVTGFVSNGNGTPRVLEYIRPHIDLYKVDLKSFDDRHYRELGGRLQPILETIEWLHRAGVWVEIVTLLVPGFNDSEAELRGLTQFLAGVSPDIPWHVTAFHKDYKMTDPANTTPAMLVRAAQHRTRVRTAVRLRRQPSGPRRRSRAHLLPRLRRSRHHEIRVSHPGIPADAGRRLPAVRDRHPRPLERRVRGPAHGVPLPAARPQPAQGHLARAGLRASDSGLGSGSTAHAGLSVGSVDSAFSLQPEPGARSLEPEARHGPLPTTGRIRLA